MGENERATFTSQRRFSQSILQVSFLRGPGGNLWHVQDQRVQTKSEHHPTLSMQDRCLPAREVMHVGVLLRLLGQILGLKRLRAHPDGL